MIVNFLIFASNLLINLLWTFVCNVSWEKIAEPFKILDLLISEEWKTRENGGVENFFPNKVKRDIGILCRHHRMIPQELRIFGLGGQKVKCGILFCTQRWGRWRNCRYGIWFRYYIGQNDYTKLWGDWLANATCQECAVNQKFNCACKRIVPQNSQLHSVWQACLLED